MLTSLGYGASATPSNDSVCRFELEYCLGHMLSIDAVFHRSGPPTFAVAALGGVPLTGIDVAQHQPAQTVAPATLVFESLRLLVGAVSNHFKVDIERKLASTRSRENMLDGSAVFAAATALLDHPGLRFLVRDKTVVMSVPLWQISDSDGPPSTAGGKHTTLTFMSRILDDGTFSQPDSHVTPLMSLCPLPVLGSQEAFSHFVKRTSTSVRDMWKFRRAFFRKLGELFHTTIEWDRATQTRRSFLVNYQHDLWVLRVDTASTAFPNAPPLVNARPYLSLLSTDNRRSLTPGQIPHQATPDESALWLHQHIVEYFSLLNKEK